ncbi:sugar-transfer associated ATP-grasp domain-containing protein [Ponticaulis profundi]|uniref:Sugar-transfer associated ATP-grasp domain-containing protein n=1 Tax=Ponticaulis profundi TaxID=2665222 RepID=A0ABW1SBE9_9PROT
MSLASLKLKNDQTFDMTQTVTRLKDVAAETGRSPLSLLSEWWKISKQPGKLSIFEYLQYELYKTDLEASGKQTFISERLHWPVTDKVSDLHWRATTEDKWLSYKILSSLGAAVPTTLAVADTSLRRFGDSQKLATLDELVSFLENQTEFPIFAKPNGELGSYGALLIEGYDNGELIVNGGDRIDLAELYAEKISKTIYLFQRRVTCHPDIQKLTSHVATMRTVNLVKDDVISTPYILFKIPVGNNVADNFWRSGNLLALIDKETGKIARVVSREGFETVQHENHPVTGEPLIGFQLPFFKEALELNDMCAHNFTPVRYQSLDIALTAEGPLVIEINAGSSFVLPQTATGKGMLDDELKDFFDTYSAA